MDTDTLELIRVLKDLKVGGITKVVKLTGAQIGVTGATYSSGVVLGTANPIKVECLRSKDNGYGSGIIQSIITRDLSKQSGDYDVLFFDSEPTSTIFTNNSALDISDSDMEKFIGRISVVATDYSLFADNAEATSCNKALPVQSILGGSLWIAFVSRAAKTYVANEFGVSIGILQD